MGKCSNNHLVSGDICHICSERINPEKVKAQGINKVGKRRANELAEYNAKEKKFLEDNPRCAVFPRLASSEVHHKKGRVGSLYLDERYWLAVSRLGHKEIELNPVWAKKMGYSLLRLEKNEEII